VSVTDDFRGRLSLDGQWRLVRDRDGAQRVESLPDGEPIVVPGCWEAQVAEPFGIIHAWIWRDFEIPMAWATDAEPTIVFGAVMYRCEVWLDGERLTVHEGGYTPFEVSIASARRGGRHRLAVRVTNPANAVDEFPALTSDRLDRAEARVPDLPIREIPHGKQTWYASQSGIWRSVVLEARPLRRIDRLRARASWGDGTVAVSAAVVGADAETLELSILSPDGVAVAGASVPVAAGKAEATLDVPDHLAWEPGSPTLYHLNARLIAGGRPADAAATRFGFREVRTVDGKVTLNGRPILLRGALDQDIWPGTLVAPARPELYREQLVAAASMGLNLLRCHIKVPDPVYLDAADEAGMLLWCELPNALRLTAASAKRLERTLEEMVELAGDHPSVVIWTIINEDWGTDLRQSAEDRAWLRRTSAWLRARDPDRLVVDNSPCPAPGGPNFHVDTDLADFHRYAAMPDAAPRWREQMAELATRPAWLWSPHGDAVRRGDEPVVVSEFGTWGLPEPTGLDEAWWSRTGDGPARAAGLEQRFREQRLDRVWPDASALATGTRALQLEALRYQIGEIRRHPEMAGLVVTEFTDANWEPNGLLDLGRGPKHDPSSVAELVGPACLIVDLPRHDLWADERLECRVLISDEEAGSGGILHWQLGPSSGELRVSGWGPASATHLGDFQISVPSVDATTDLDLEVELKSNGRVVASTRIPCAVLPARLRQPAQRRSFTVQDPATEPRLAALGHRQSPDPDVLVVRRLAPGILDAVERGGRVLLLADNKDAVPDSTRLGRPLRVTPRWPRGDRDDLDITWSGDWISAYSWVLPSLSPDLPRRAPLDFAYAEVLPQHVLTGYDPRVHVDEVLAGMFVGWVHAPAALIWRFPVGRGWITATTFRMTSGGGPVWTVLLEALVQLAIAEDE
jgi:hypothetical protein